jgi:hypothetical protein
MPGVSFIIDINLSRSCFITKYFVLMSSFNFAILLSLIIHKLHAHPFVSDMDIKLFTSLQCSFEVVDVSD